MQNYTNMLDFGVSIADSVNRPRFGNAYTPAGGALLAVREPEPFTLHTLRVYHTRDPQPPTRLFDLRLTGPS